MTKQELWHQPTYISMNNRRRHRPSRPPQPSPDDRRKPSSNSKNNAMKTETEMVYPLDKNQAISAVSTLRSATALHSGAKPKGPHLCSSVSICG